MVRAVVEMVMQVEAEMVMYPRRSHYIENFRHLHLPHNIHSVPKYGTSLPGLDDSKYQPFGFLSYDNTRGGRH